MFTSKVRTLSDNCEDTLDGADGEGSDGLGENTPSAIPVEAALRVRDP